MRSTIKEMVKEFGTGRAEFHKITTFLFYSYAKSLTLERGSVIVSGASFMSRGESPSLL